MSSNIKFFIKFIIYRLIDLFIKPSQNIKPKTILLIRLDAIGDYVLFRNYIEVLKKSQKYKEYKITLIGNTDWKNLSQELDSEYIDEFIWLDRDKFLKDFRYRYEKLKKIVSQGYEVALSPVYGREFFYADNIIKIINAKEKIGSIGDLSNITKWQKNLSDKYYTKLLVAKEEIIFEFYRNKEFFENLLKIKLDIKAPFIYLKEKKSNFKLPNNYAILFVGASADYRKWNIKNFAEIGKYLKIKYGYEIVVCGGSDDIHNAKKFTRYFDGEYVDLVGKTSLVDLLYVIYNAKLIIANETSAPHLAIALEKIKVFVLSNANHYGRFTPYPKEISLNYHAIYHPKIEKDLNNYKKLSNIYGCGSNLDINEISVEYVIKNLEEV